VVNIAARRKAQEKGKGRRALKTVRKGNAMPKRGTWTGRGKMGQSANGPVSHFVEAQVRGEKFRRVLQL